MRDLNHDFKNLCQRNRDGSFATQHDRESILTLIANQLDEDGFRHLRATGVRSKHVQHLVERWHAEEISAGKKTPSGPRVPSRAIAGAVASTCSR